MIVKIVGSVAVGSLMEHDTYFNIFLYACTVH